VVTDGGLLEVEHRLEVADTDCGIASGEQAVEDLQPAAVGERFEDGL
jgi:hypothetical protein